MNYEHLKQFVNELRDKSNLSAVQPWKEMRQAATTIEDLIKENQELAVKLGGYTLPPHIQAEIAADKNKLSELSDKNYGLDIDNSRLRNKNGELEQELSLMREALREIATYDEQSMWEDDRDDAASGMLSVARKAIGMED